MAGTATTVTQGGTYMLPGGALRLIFTGGGRIVLSVQVGSTQGNVPLTVDFQGPGTVLIEPNPGQTVAVTLCNP